MLIYDLDYSEKIDSESRVSGGKTATPPVRSVYRYTKVRVCKTASNGKGKTCKTSYAEYKSGNAKTLNPNATNGSINRVEKIVPAVSLASLCAELF